MFSHTPCNTSPVITLAFRPLGISREWKVIISFSPGSFICFYSIACGVSWDKTTHFLTWFCDAGHYITQRNKTRRMWPLAKDTELLCDYFLYDGLLWLNVLHETFRANWSHLNGTFSLGGNEVAWKIKEERKTLIEHGAFKGLKIALSSSSFL